MATAVLIEGIELFKRKVCRIPSKGWQGFIRLGIQTKSSLIRYNFVKTHRNELNRKPFAAFLVCMTLAMPKGESYRGTVTSWLDPVRSLVSPIDVGLFKGTLDVKKIQSFSERYKFRMSVLFGIWKEGDHRDWVSIQNWTENLRSHLDKSTYSLT